MAVTRWVVKRRSAFADGKTFDQFGEYEQIEGEIHFAVDPSAAANQQIVDLSLASDEDGLVRFSADFVLVTPKDPERSSGRLLVDVPNRGNPLTSGTLHKVVTITPEDRLKPGDGFLCRRGFSYISVGWQWDAQGAGALKLNAPVATIDDQSIDGQVLMKLQPLSDQLTLPLVQLGQTSPPYPVMDLDSGEHVLYEKAHENDDRTEIPRDQWRFARESEGQIEASDRAIYLEGGFRKGKIYELAYRTRGAPVVGAGLLALRDAATSLSRGDTGSPLQCGFQYTYAFGVSQTGRVLRQFLYDGLNVDETGQRVFDGVWLHIAGAQRGDFNHRFAQPTVVTSPSLGQRFPFSTTSAKDLFSARTAGLLDRLPADMQPRIVISNTAFEYWRGDAALAHILGDVDLPAQENTRIYQVAGTHHIGGILIHGRQISEIAATGLKTAEPFNTVSYGPVNRAMLAILDDWVSRGIEPPPSRHPRVDDGTAVPRDEVLAHFQQRGDVALLAPEKLQSIRHQVEQPGNDQGQVHLPVEEGEAYAAYVSAVDEDGNETAGILLPDIACPLGCHTGWNPRHPDTGGEDLAAIFAGFTRFFDREEILARYGDESGYMDQVNAVITQLVTERFVLEEDVEWLIRLARDRFRAASALEAESVAAPV